MGLWRSFLEWIGAPAEHKALSAGPDVWLRPGYVDKMESLINELTEENAKLREEAESSKAELARVRQAYLRTKSELADAGMREVRQDARIAAMAEVLARCRCRN